jgi:glycosyltransferase 2 family protein
MKILLKWIKKNSYLVGIIIFVYILLRIDIGKLYSILITSDVKYIFLSAFIAPLIILGMTLRWYLILKALGIIYDFTNTCISLIKGALFGEIIPGRLGEFVRAKYVIAKTGSSIGKTMFSVVVDRIYDVIILVILGVSSSIVLVKIYAVDFSLSMIIIWSALLFVFLAICMNEKIVRTTIIPLFSFLTRHKYQEHIHFHSNEFYRSSKLMGKGTHATCMVLTIVIWLLTFVALFFLSKSLRIDIPLWLVLSIGAISVIVSLLPLSVSGLGTRDAVFIFFLSFYGVPVEFAVALSFLFLVYGLLSTVLAWGSVNIYEMVLTVNFR